MPKMQSQRARARRTAPLDLRWPVYVRLAPGVLNVGLAALAVSILGLGVAAGIQPTSAAQTTVGSGPSPVVTTVVPGVDQPSEFERDSSTVSRAGVRTALIGSGQAADLDPSVTAEATTEAAADKARAALLAKESKATAEQQQKLIAAKKKAVAAKKKADAAKKALGTPTLPVKSYTVAARFGDVGVWARYHTGFDFAAPIGTPIHAPTAGVVEHAGPGGDAGGWAGNYVVLKHADGTHTLYAHMSSISVQVGQKVVGGNLLGQVGQTGRAFGPHLHFEVYPPGTKPGDVYTAVDPVPWLHKLGLKP